MRLALLLALAGCGLKAIDYPTPASEMEKRNGFFTGPTGEATVYRR